MPQGSPQEEHCKRLISVDANILILWSKSDPSTPEAEPAKRAYAFLESFRGQTNQVLLVVSAIALEELLRQYEKALASEILRLLEPCCDIASYDCGTALTAAEIYHEAKQAVLPSILADGKKRGKQASETDYLDDIKIIATCLRQDVDTLYSNDADLAKIAALGQLDVKRLPDYTRPLF
jgi:predicted nucleic acid-binding protein